MNIVIVGGDKKVDFLVKSLLSKRHDITVINDDEKYCKDFAHTHNVKVVHGDGSRPRVLEEAGIRDANLMIALTPSDSDNLIICQMAKRIFSVKRVFATVTNPKNVDVFKKIGVDTVLSATHILARVIEQMAYAHEIVNCLPMEGGKIQLMEFSVTSENKICDKQLFSIGFPKNAIIGCIIRNERVIIPSGQTKFEDGDRLTVLASADAQKDVLKIMAEMD